MKRLLKVTKLSLAALVAFAITPVNAGEYCPPECKTPCCTTCCNTGYIFGYGGFSYLDDHDVYTPDNTTVISSEFDFGDNFILGGGVGLRSDFFGGTRFEIEGLWSKFSSDSVAVNAGNGQNLQANGLESDLTVTAGLVNVLKEVCLPFGLTGFGGVGAGIANTEYSIDVPGGVRFQSDDMSLAFQLTAGADLPVSDCLSLFGAYKLLYVTEQEYSLAGAVAIDGDAFITHNFVVGARVSF